MKVLLSCFFVACITSIGFTQPALTLWISPDASHYQYDHNSLQEYKCDSSYYIYYHNHSDTLFITVKNEGSEPLDLTDVSTEFIAGASFEVIGFTPQVLIPNDMYTIKIAFLLPPEYVDGVNGQITFASNDPGKANCALYLDVGCSADWSFSTGSLKMGIQATCEDPVVYVSDGSASFYQNIHMIYNESMRFYSYDSEADTSHNTMQLSTDGVLIPDALGVDQLFLAGGVIGMQNPTFRVIPGKVNVEGILEVAILTNGSDARKKTEISPIHNAVQKMMLLGPKSYFLKDSLSIDSRQYGFIAQDLETILPEIVHGDGDEMKSVNYIQLIPWLTAALQEQQKMIEKLEERVAELVIKTGM